MTVTDKRERSSHDGTGAGAGEGGGASQKMRLAWAKIADETRWCFQDGVFRMLFSRCNDLPELSRSTPAMPCDAE